MQTIEQYTRVYARINSNNEITAINSEIFIKDFTGWIEIDRGIGSKYARAQCEYLDSPLANDDGTYNYKLLNGKVIAN